MNQPGQKENHIRSRCAHRKQDPRQQQLRIHVPRLHKHRQRHADNRISDHGHPPHAQTVRHEAPGRTRHQGDDLVGEAQRADDVAHAVLLADQVGDDEGDGAVEEDEERDGEERDAQQVRGGLRGSRRGRKGQEALDGERHFGGFGCGDGSTRVFLSLSSVFVSISLL